MTLDSAVRRLTEKNRLWLSGFIEDDNSQHYTFFGDDCAYIFNESSLKGIMKESGLEFDSEEIFLCVKEHKDKILFFSRLYRLNISNGRIQLTKEMMRHIPDGCRVFKITKMGEVICLEYCSDNQYSKSCYQGHC